MTAAGSTAAPASRAAPAFPAVASGGAGYPPIVAPPRHPAAPHQPGAGRAGGGQTGAGRPVAVRRGDGRRPAVDLTARPAAPPVGLPRRVTVAGERCRVDLALPGECTVAELIPILRGLTGTDGDAYAWVLCRFGGPPLPAEATVASAGIRDGDLLHLVPDDPAVPPVVFDDPVEAIASAVDGAPGRWNRALAGQVAAVAAAVTFVAAGIAVAALPPFGPFAAVLLGVVLPLSGHLLARRHVPGVGAALAAAGPPVLLAAVVALPYRLVLPGGQVPALAAGLAAAAGAAALAAVLLPRHRPWFAVAAGTCAAGTVAAGSVLADGVTPAAVAAVTLVLAIVLGPAFPAFALRLGGVPAPEVPADMEAFRAVEQPRTVAETAGPARSAESALTALLTAQAIVAGTAALVLLVADARFATPLTAVAGLALLLRSRGFRSVAQHAALLLGGAAILTGAAVRTVTAGGDLVPALVGTATVLTGAGCAWFAARAAHRPASPYWARALDAADFTAVLALVPLAAAVLDLYRLAATMVG
ncbi:type VII secretion integral membrane protein EccD [Catenuloplanes nepalensis]|uniref:Type VII secretion integral membrane protein EccD n=1 Tax=Catenuloplanes nepalensis TaxID=587533 RepID=A0ABT9MS06_9ACTN|nr:type VII secretion integral membrane protein EccD [Catenuloplanes nepalensis]MDP9794071.1 type VII secretion integral membrane protein EccD [Catenuloplanes nepalensis]